MEASFNVFSFENSVIFFARIVKSRYLERLKEQKLWLNILIRVSENGDGVLDNFETGDSWSV